MKKLTTRLFEKDGKLYRAYKFYTPWKVYEYYIEEWGWRPKREINNNKFDKTSWYVG